MTTALATRQWHPADGPSLALQAPLIEPPGPPGGCHRISVRDWSAIAPTTDDFVIFPADGSDYFDDYAADMQASIPPEKLDLLRGRGLVP